MLHYFQLPPEATSLLHEPGKLPEQSGFYAPKPWTYREGTKNGLQIKVGMEEVGNRNKGGQ